MANPRQIELAIALANILSPVEQPKPLESKDTIDEFALDEGFSLVPDSALQYETHLTYASVYDPTLHNESVGLGSSVMLPVCLDAEFNPDKIIFDEKTKTCFYLTHEFIFGVRKPETEYKPAKLDLDYFNFRSADLTSHRGFLTEAFTCLTRFLLLPFCDIEASEDFFHLRNHQLQIEQQALANHAFREFLFSNKFNLQEQLKAMMSCHFPVANSAPQTLAQLDAKKIIENGITKKFTAYKSPLSLLMHVAHNSNFEAKEKREIVLGMVRNLCYPAKEQNTKILDEIIKYILKNNSLTNDTRKEILYKIANSYIKCIKTLEQAKKIYHELDTWQILKERDRNYQLSLWGTTHLNSKNQLEPVSARYCELMGELKDAMFWLLLRANKKDPVVADFIKEFTPFLVAHRKFNYLSVNLPGLFNVRTATVEKVLEFKEEGDFCMVSEAKREPAAIVQAGKTLYSALSVAGKAGGYVWNSYTGFINGILEANHPERRVYDDMALLKPRRKFSANDE